MGDFRFLTQLRIIDEDGNKTNSHVWLWECRKCGAVVANTDKHKHE